LCFQTAFITKAVIFLIFWEGWYMKKRSFSFFLAVASLLMAGLFGLIQPTAAHAAAPTPANAYEVVRFGAHDSIVREISFNSTTPISGMDGLNLTGLHVVTMASSYGPYVCSINGVGDCSGTAHYYWAYYHWNTTSSAWDYSGVGPSDFTVSAGAVEGWVYLGWSDDSSQPNLPSAQRAMEVPVAAAWLQSQQSSSTGGYDSTGDSVEGLMAVGSDGYSAASWIRKGGSRSLETYWLANGAAYAKKSGDAAGKLAVGLQSACACWPSSALHPTAYYNASSGMYANGAGPQAWAILGSLSLGDSVPGQAVTALKGMVQSDGGWEWQAGFGSDTNTTALVLQALLAKGGDPSSTLITSALTYLQSAQKDDGGIAYTPATSASDADSSAYAVMAIQTTGGDPSGSGWTKNGNTPVSYLLGLQLSNGSFEWQKGSGANLLATSQTISALLGNDYLLNANFSISGKVTGGTPATGMGGVKVALGSYSDITASDGTYTIISIPPGAKGSLIASKAGFIFKPISIAAMTATLGGKNFVATPTTYTISGKVTIGGKALKGVTIKTTSDITIPSVVSNSSGNYTITKLSANHVYTVTPLLTGYSFNPTNFVSPAPTLSSNLTANFAATLLYENISGTISGLGGVPIQIRYGSGKTQLVPTDNNGAYSINLPENVGYTLTPLSPLPPSTNLYRFDPTFIPIPAANGSNSSANFAATKQVVMNGKVTAQGKAVNGVKISNGSFSTLTNSLGKYSLWVPYNVSITPTATHPFFTFTDAVSPVTPTSNFSQNWYQAQVNISGEVTLNGASLPGVVLTVNAAKGETPLSTSTDSSGAYSLTVHDTDTPNLASFTLTPVMDYYTFSPKSQTFSSSSGVAKNFIAGIPNWNVSGLVTMDSKGLGGVEIDATINGAPIKVITDSSGAYTISGVPRNASINLSARKYGYTFSSGNTSVVMGQADVQGQNFSATPLPLDKSISGTIVLNGTTNPLAGVVVSLSYQGMPIFTTKTAKDGSYNFPNLLADSVYLVVPKLSKYSFTPPNKEIDLSTSSATEQDFSATCLK
jgi:hypothetical protein